MKFTVLHPTARTKPYPSFPDGWLGACRQWWKSCHDPSQVEYIIVVHQSRMVEFWRELCAFGSIPCWGRFTVVENKGRDCLVDQCNAGLQAMTGEILVSTMDDLFAPQNWDQSIEKEIPDTSQTVALQVWSGSPRDRELFTCPGIETAVLMREYGLISTDYLSMFSDDEWCERVKKLGWVRIAPNTHWYRWEHRHPVFGTAESDAVYELENHSEAYRIGREVLEKRRALGFPRVPFPDESPEVSALFAQSTATPPLLALCTPGDCFSGVWQDAYFNLGLRLGQEGYAVKRYRAYYSNVYNTRIQLAERVISEAKESGQTPKYVLWIDGDNILLPDQLTGLIQFLDHYEQVDGIAGWCWIRKDGGWTTSAGNFWPDDGVHLMAMNLDALFAGQTAEEKFGPKPIEHSGFPALLMRYDALEHLGAAAFRPITKADLPAYFGESRPSQQVTDEWYAGEDTAWFLRAKKAGMQFVVDPGCKVGHLKLQLQEPDVVKINNETAPELIEWREGLNGKPISAPAEYEKVGQ